jgi:glycerol-3-phosphate dehydrogenase (NAD(P)+)
MKITILGGGSFGTALAIHLADRHKVRIWEFFKEQADKMQNERYCPLLPDAQLSDNIFVTSDMSQALDGNELVLLAVPSDKAEDTIAQAKEFISSPIIICSKGFGSNLTLLSDVVKKQVENKHEVYCLYGPSHAEEVGKGMFTGVVLAGGDGRLSIKKVIASDNLKVDLTDDIIGVQVAAALKNIVAVFVGVLDGLKLGDNANAYVMTKGLQEIELIGLKWGAKGDTFLGLAGVGDVIVTCSSEHSRNRFVGQEVGRGLKLDDVIYEMKMVAEGVITLKEAIKLKDKFELELPLISGLYDILFEGKDAKEILKSI